MQTTTITQQFYISKIMPVGLFMAATLFTGNQVYLYLTVSFIQMLKVRWAQEACPYALCSAQCAALTTMQATVCQIDESSLAGEDPKGRFNRVLLHLTELFA